MIKLLVNILIATLVVLLAVGCGDNFKDDDSKPPDAAAPTPPSGLLGAWTFTADVSPCRAAPQVMTVDLFPQDDLVIVTTGQEVVAVGAELGATTGHVWFERNPGNTGAEDWDLHLTDDGTTTTATLDWSGPGDQNRGCEAPGAPVTVTDRERIAP